MKIMINSSSAIHNTSPLAYIHMCAHYVQMFIYTRESTSEIILCTPLICLISKLYFSSSILHRISLWFLGTGNVSIASILARTGFTSPYPTTCPRYTPVAFANSVFAKFIVNFARDKTMNSPRIDSRCALQVVLATKMSSMYAVLSVRSAVILLIIR